MEVANFAAIQPEFIARVSQAVYCAMATVDHQNRPRLRLMHFVWEGPVGWVISWPASPKAQHLAHNPSVALAYIQNAPQPVYVDGTAKWVDDIAEKQRIWELHKAIPPPLGFDPEPHYGTIENPYYGLIRLTPQRITLANLGGEPVVWRPQRGA